jgi:hypothetical protein
VDLRLSRLRWPEWLIGAGSAVLLASMLALHWYAHSTDGWHGLRHARWLVAVTVAVGFLAVVAQASRQAPAVPVTLTLFAMLLGGLTVLWLIYRVLISPPGGDRMAGGFIGLAGACAVAYGSWRSLRTEGIAPEDAPSEIPVVDPHRRPPDQRPEHAT